MAYPTDHFAVSQSSAILARSYDRTNCERRSRHCDRSTIFVVVV
jgi:hypothetical protein